MCVVGGALYIIYLRKPLTTSSEHTVGTVEDLDFYLLYMEYVIFSMICKYCISQFDTFIFILVIHFICHLVYVFFYEII